MIDLNINLKSVVVNTELKRLDLPEKRDTRSHRNMLILKKKKRKIRRRRK
jgi:hypothetical protein